MKGKYVRFKNYSWKIKSPLMIYPYFEDGLVPEYNGSKVKMSLIRINYRVVPGTI